MGASLLRRPRSANQKPVRLTNARCPRCDGPVYFDEVGWLHCPRCAKPRTVYTLARKDGAK